MKAQLPIKRQMSNHRSPIIGQLNAMITGIGEKILYSNALDVSSDALCFSVSIRAYGAEAPFRKENLRHINEYIRPARSYYDCNRYILRIVLVIL